jgi:alanyl-tRNA synthetase
MIAESFSKILFTNRFSHLTFYNLYLRAAGILISRPEGHIMITEKLYYKDSYKKSFTARLLAQKQDEKGVWLLLDQTLFYPGGGGQLPDQGQINNLTVKDVKEDNDQIWHLVSGVPVPADNVEVKAAIDWERRYYNMQQHSGQHLLSHVLHESGMKTVSVHLGESYTLIEVEGNFPDHNLLGRLEELCSELIRKALMIKTCWVTKDEIDRFPLRRPAGDWRRLRVVEIDALDFSACGGTHVKSTSEIGCIKIIGLEKIRGHARIKAVIGKRADQYFEQLHRVHIELKELLQTETENFAERIRSLKNEIKKQKKETDFYIRNYIQSKSKQIFDANNLKDDIIVYHLQEGKLENAQELARNLADNYNQITFIYYENRFFLTAPADSNFNTSHFLNNYRAALGLKGGGPAGFVQGIIEKPDESALREALLEFRGNEN